MYYCHINKSNIIREGIVNENFYVCVFRWDGEEESSASFPCANGVIGVLVCRAVTADDHYEVEMDNGSTLGVETDSFSKSGRMFMDHGELI